MHFSRIRPGHRLVSTSLAALLMLLSPLAWAAHGYALWDELKYPAGFTHFGYVNAAAPKGGELRLVSNLRVSTFDKYNPFTLRGNAPAYLSALMFESLQFGSQDETASDLAAQLSSVVGQKRVYQDSVLASTQAQHLTLVEAEQSLTGVDVDVEMESLLLIEQAYAANARVIQVARDMIGILMEL